MNRAAAILLAGLLAGCTTLPPAEQAWQALHAIDTVQTLHIARDPARFHEDIAAWAIGRHPSAGSVLAYMAGTAVIHAQCARWLDDRHPLGFKAFEVISIGLTGRNVLVNVKVGL